MLLHIIKIEHSPVFHLRGSVTLEHRYEIVPNDNVPWEELPISGMATLETTESVENGIRKVSSRLSGTLCGCQLPASLQPTAFRIASANGEVHIISETPRASLAVIQEMTIPKNTSEPSTVTFTASGDVPALRVVSFQEI